MSEHSAQKPAPEPAHVTAAEFDAKFDAGEDNSEHLDVRAARVFKAGEERLDSGSRQRP